jgi:hypothetical protein
LPSGEYESGVVTAARPETSPATICTYCGEVVTRGWTIVCSQCRMPLS